jgi:hypothetical protein
MAKISISIADADVAWLKKRARKLHAGNLSAAVSEATSLLRHFDAMHGLLDRLGAPRLTEAEVATVDAELSGTSTRPKRRRAA